MGENEILCRILNFKKNVRCVEVKLRYMIFILMLITLVYFVMVEGISGRRTNDEP